MEKKDRLKELASNVEADYSIWKIIAVVAFTCISAGAFGYFMGRGIVGGIVGTGILLLSCFVMQALLIKGFLRFLLGAALESVFIIAPVYFMVTDFPIVSLGFAAVLSFLFIVWAQFSARDALENEIRVRFLKISKAVLPKSFTALAIIIAVFYGFSFKKEALFSPEFVNPIVDFASPVVGYFVPNFYPDMSARDFLAVSAGQSLAKNGVIDFNVMPESLRNQVIEKTVQESAKALESSFGINIDLDSSFKENIRIIFAERFEEAVSGVQPYFISLVMAVLIFAAVKSVGFVLYYPVAFVAFVMYQVILSTGFAETELEPRSREIVVMK